MPTSLQAYSLLSKDVEGDVLPIEDLELGAHMNQELQKPKVFYQVPFKEVGEKSEEVT